MSTGITIVQVLIAVAVLVLVIGRRFAPHPIKDDRRRWRLPLVLVVIGIANLVQLRHHTPPITLTGTDLAFLIAGGLISAVLGAMRGFTVRIYTRGGQPMQRYTIATAALWIGTIAVRVGLDVVAPSLGVAKAVASASLLLMFGVSLIGESLAVTARTGGFATRTA
ncbi:MAG TPA: hypothetical protein VFU65_19790 [Actinocrinis sp.]|nr:hypothetical protein [Actinocrinis sp.]